MTKYYYVYNTHGMHGKRLLRLFSFGLLSLGVGILVYVLIPLVNWQLYFLSAFASQYFSSPIPQNALVASSPQSTFASSIDYTNAKNWFPNAPKGKTIPSISSYTLSIPKIGIANATVSTIDNNLASHLVHYEGTALPPTNGNTVIFGHSTLPQLFNAKDYKTIFAKAHLLAPGDKVYLSVSGVQYAYRIYSTIVVDPSETSIFNQDYAYSHLTLVTCTPPGTVWKRLIIKARIEKL
ncbi:MAG: hypothetical protein A3J69_00640 [Candidatus Levybacteria bacterium RIFCSPHIGHO2_02_FULL_42_12]|nr:MAG: hypothetical protein A3J69_00640 [Candidatus Levybacteria bacterium RIFCSPHIGHO2_02_FULL_42_12]OGH42602.1 MAG: hypothetical protein A3B53_01755 [Candidatus Levybacteria bacterium RIFCSPLOWO2_01_FULL_42_15]